MCKIASLPYCSVHGTALVLHSNSAPVCCLRAYADQRRSSVRELEAAVREAEQLVRWCGCSVPASRSACGPRHALAQHSRCVNVASSSAAV